MSSSQTLAPASRIPAASVQAAGGVVTGVSPAAGGRGSDVSWLPDAALADELRASWERVCAAQAEFTRVLGVFDARGAGTVDGAPSTVAWLRGFLHVAPGQAADLVRSARHLPALPTIAADHAAGLVSAAHVAVLTRAAEKVGIATVAAAEPVLAEAARRLDPTRLSVVTARLRHTVDPDGALDETNQIHQRRRLHLSQTFDGAWVLDALLDAEGGAVLRTALDAVLVPPAQGEDRTPAQRRADALIDLAHAHLRHGETPDVAGQRPHLTVTIDAASVAGHGPGAQFDRGGHAHAETARRIACDASITRVVLGPAGQPLNVGRRTRLISPALRRALTVRDRGCRFPGCTRPAAWTDAHHLTHWAHGGTTALPNLVLLCRHHHRLTHEGRWTLAGTPDALTVTRPDGTPLEPP